MILFHHKFYPLMYFIFIFLITINWFKLMIVLEQEHPGISKSERKRICRLMDCKKLSSDACKHAVQNERLPLRVVVQVLFFEQIRPMSSSGTTPDLPGPIRALIPSSGSHGSSRSATTNTEEDWDSVPTAEELKALKGELATLHLHDQGSGKTNPERISTSKANGMITSKKIFSKLWSNNERQSENSGSDTSDRSSTQGTKSSPSLSRRQSLS